ncbi:MAG: bifunctional diguanylate cyclase/phosphodiesterase, partial [Gammaproteobacteria bacterium]
HSDGSERWLHTRGVPRSLDDGSIVWDDIGLDITDRKKAQQQLEYNARFDQLTGLPNRQSLIQQLREIIRTMHSDHGEVIILAIGLERLEHIIQTFGHDMGDAIICKTATVLEETISGEGLIGRSGGSFLICEPTRDGQDSLIQVIDQIHALFNKELVLEDTSIPIQIRIGATIYPNDKTSCENLIRHAEIALSQNRLNHSFKYQMYSDDLKEGFLRRLEIERGLRKAIVSDQLITYYQPIIDIHSNRPIGCEALARWKTEEGNFIPPDEFIPVAEETGLIIELGNKIIENVCKQYSTWKDMGLGLQYISVNVAAKQLQSTEFVEYVEYVLKEYNVPAASLKIELTESDLMDDPQAAIDTMLKLNHLKIGLAIDDFGTGLSSLSYLQKFPIELLKIDKSFISNIDKDRGQAAIVQAITAMARAMGHRTIAEGVETEEHRLFVKAYGVDYVQGYLVSRPLPVIEFPDFINNYKVG